VTQGKFIALLWIFIAVIISAYYGWLMPVGNRFVTLPIILAFSVVGILGSYGVAWFGIRVNTFANSRTAFAGLRGKPYPCYAIPLKAGMSIGMLLISVELLIMLAILLFIQPLMPDPALSASPSENPSAPRPCVSPAASSPRSPTSAPI